MFYVALLYLKYKMGPRQRQRLTSDRNKQVVTEKKKSYILSYFGRESRATRHTSFALDLLLIY